ncbi:MAG: hypothetical protein J4O03_07425 [Chloroflexi bacterium]|nr:hypothetical protein [Chloroflexota bacterium]
MTVGDPLIVPATPEVQTIIDLAARFGVSLAWLDKLVYPALDGGKEGDLQTNIDEWLRTYNEERRLGKERDFRQAFVLS